MKESAASQASVRPVRRRASESGVFARTWEQSRRLLSCCTASSHFHRGDPLNAATGSMSRHAGPTDPQNAANEGKYTHSLTTPTLRAPDWSVYLSIFGSARGDLKVPPEKSTPPHDASPEVVVTWIAVSRTLERCRREKTCSIHIFDRLHSN